VGGGKKYIKERGVEKTPVCSSIGINGILHEFVAKDVLQLTSSV